MYRIRFHGRGGHGMKTASRIVGTAAFLEGYYVQDFPLYGAERRGAPVTAYTRISNKPVLERGIFTDPDVIIIADDFLIEDPVSNPLRGADPSTIIVINTTVSDDGERFNIKGRVTTVDATGICLEVIGKGAAISGAIGGAACKLLGFIPVDAVERAVIKELQSLGISGGLIEKNVEVAIKCFESLPSFNILTRDRIHAVSTKTMTIPYHDPVVSSPSVYAPGNIVEKHTGGWRIFMPVINYEKCNKCWLCFVWCPDGVIALDDSDYPHIDYDHWLLPQGLHLPRAHGFLQIHTETCQEVLDSILMAYRIAEDKRVLLPLLINMDGYYLSFTREPVEIPDRDKVKEFLPPYRPEHAFFHSSHPMAQGVAVLGGPIYSYFKYQMHLASLNALEVHEKVTEEFNHIFGRKYGATERYRMDDAEYVIVMSNAFATKGKAAVDHFRERGYKVGLFRLRLVRPFPGKEIVDALKDRKGVAVIDQNISVG